MNKIVLNGLPFLFFFFLIPFCTKLLSWSDNQKDFVSPTGSTTECSTAQKAVDKGRLVPTVRNTTRATDDDWLTVGLVCQGPKAAD